MYALKSPYRRNAKFLMNDAMVSMIRKLKDNNGAYLWQPSIQAGEPDRLLGYRVRKSWPDAKSQKGAYKILDNAKKCADQNPGYKVFDVNGNVVYEPKAAEPAFVSIQKLKNV